MATERLQKIMAACGVASRRKAEEMIASGRVTLNGEVVTELGTKADTERDQICVDGKPLKGPERLLYFLLHKPKGYVTTVSDPEGRLTVMELMKKCPEARVSRGAAGLCQRRLAVDDERRGAGAKADEGGFARAEDVSGENQRKAR